MRRTDNSGARRGGFTLVELIVVLIMVSLLASIAVPSYLGYVDDNKKKQCAKNREMLAAYMDEMLVTGSAADMSAVIAAHPEISCPAGGTYQLHDGVGNTVECNHEGHEGVTTVIMKSSSVKVDVNNVKTEAPESKPEEGGGENSDPPKNEALLPNLTFSVSPNSVELEVGETQVLSVADVTKSNCSVVGYSWWSGDNSAVSVDWTSTGETATITANAATDTPCIIYCKANAVATAEAGGGSFSTEPKNVSVTVRVKPSFSISLTPDHAENVEVNSSLRLTAVPKEVGCAAIDNSYNWQLSSEDGLSITSGWNTPTITIEADKASEYTVYCQARARSNVGDEEVLSNQATATIKVKVPETESETEKATETDTQRFPEMMIIREPSQMNGIFYLYLPYYLDLNGISLPVGGGWSANSPKINRASDYTETQREGWKLCIDDEHHALNSSRGNTYELYYKVTVDEVEKTYILPIRVIYPSYTFVKYLKGNDGNNVNDYINVTEGETIEFGITYGPHYTTDTIQWSNSDDTVVGMTSLENRMANGDNATYTWKFTAKTLGESVITATLLNEKFQVSNEKKWIVRVIEPNQMTGISVWNMQLDKGQRLDVDCTVTPYGAATEGVEYRYSGYDSEIIKVNASVGKAGQIEGVNYGSTSVTLKAVKNERVLASCTFDVTVSKLKNMWLEPGDVTLVPNERKDVQIKYELTRADVDISNMTFDITGNYADVLEVAKNGTTLTITGKAQGECNLKVQAKVNTDAGYILGEVPLHVKVVRIKSINVDPNPVTFTPNEEKTINLVVDPQDADLTGLTFELNRWGDLPELKSVDTENKTITIRAYGQTYGYQWQTLSVKENGNDLANCSIQTKVEDAEPLTNF